MVNYVSLAATAKRLIEANGRNVTFSIKGETPLMPDKPWRGNDPAGDNSFVAKAVIIPFEESDTEGSLVRRGDARMFVAATSATVAGKSMREVDSVLDGTELWKVVDVNDITPGPTSVLYELHIRR
jgi:hypothetical protein